MRSFALRLIAVWAVLGMGSHACAARPAQRDVLYGADTAQKMDIYLPSAPKNAPIILFVHGGAWRFGDKAAGRVVANKSAHYLAQGTIFISTNYRMEGVTPLEEANDIAAALKFIQAHAAEWGGDAHRILLMGHSAGAHLVALLSADPAGFGLAPWRGTVSLDSAAYDVPKVMHSLHLPLYDRAFGSDTALWAQASPYARLKRGSPPMLLVCSSRREQSCPQAHAFAAKITGGGGHADVLEQDKSHMEINDDLGEAGDYTATVDHFVASVLK